MLSTEEHREIHEILKYYINNSFIVTNINKMVSKVSDCNVLNILTGTIFHT